jgi:hypothetical protein
MHQGVPLAFLIMATLLQVDDRDTEPFNTVCQQDLDP